MEITYSGLYSSIIISIPTSNGKFSKIFTRGEWYNVPEEVFNILIKNDHFTSKECLTNILRYEHIYLKRLYALGDLIMLVPVARYLQKKGVRITLITSPRFVEFMKEFDCFVDVITTTIKDNSPIIVLDGILERDHNIKNNERICHRSDIYAKFLNLDIDEYDFKFRKCI